MVKRKKKLGQRAEGLEEQKGKGGFTQQLGSWSCPLAAVPSFVLQGAPSSQTTSSRLLCQLASSYILQGRLWKAGGRKKPFPLFFPSGDSWVVGDWAAAVPVSCSSSRNAGFRLPTAAKAAAMQPVAARLPGLPLSPVSSHPHPTRQPAVFTCRASARPFSFP